jgi:ATP-dependent protease ClpP protease subunit
MTKLPLQLSLKCHPPRCDVWLTKRISAKDSDARTFANLVGKLKQEHPGRTIYVCLDSEGGDLEEALKIAHYIILGGLDLTQTGT